MNTVENDKPTTQLTPPEVPHDHDVLLLECEAALVPARGSAQMICKVPRRTKVEHLELFGGPNGEPPPRDVRVIRVGVGSRMFPANVNGRDVGKWEECYGQISPAESWIVVSIINDGADPVGVGGRFQTRMEPDAPQLSTATSTIAGTSGGVVQQSQHPAMTAVQPGIPHVAAIKPGANEVVCFLTRESVRRLLESIQGGPKISAYEGADLVRRLNSAMVQP